MSLPIVRSVLVRSFLFALTVGLVSTSTLASGLEDPDQMRWDNLNHQCNDYKCDTTACMDEHTVQCWQFYNPPGCAWQGEGNPNLELGDVEGPSWDSAYGRYRYEQNLYCIADGQLNRTLEWDRPPCWDTHELGQDGNGDFGICVERSNQERYEKLKNTDGPCVGNPCNAATGDKMIQETDFEGVGIHFYRTWHSQAPIRSDSMWSRWTHSYADFLDFDAQGTLLAVVTPDGYYMTLSSTTGGVWIAPARTGLRVILSGSEYVAEYPNGETRYYDANGRLDRVEASPGQITTLTYNATSGKLTEIVGPFGHKLRLQYNGNTGMLVYMYRPDNKRFQYSSSAWNNRYRLTRIRKPSYGYVYYQYNDANWPDFITEIKDELGIIFASYTYDSVTGNALSSEHAGGAGRVDLSYATDTTTVTDGDGRVTTYNFQSNPFGGRRLVSTVRNGTTVSSTFLDGQTDALQRLGSRSSATGRTTSYGYDDHHRTSVTEAAGTPLARTTTYEYLRPDSNAVTRIIRPSAHSTNDAETTIAYNALDLPLTITESGYDSGEQPISRTTTFTYDANGQVLTIDGPRTDVTDVTTITYYNCTTGGNCGQIQTITNSLGHTTTFNSYNANGQLTKETGPNGYIREYIYDWRGFLGSVKITSPTGYYQTYTYTYNTAGLVTAAPAGPYMTTLNFTYDGARRLVEVRDAANNKIKYVYDSAGNVIEERIEDSTGSISRLVQSTFDTFSRLDTISNAGAVTDVLYDAVGKLSESEDPNQNLTQYVYDELDRLTTVVDPATESATTAYDVNDRPTLVTATNGAATSFVYDDLGNLEQEVSPDRGTTTYSYDAAGNVLTRTDARGITVTYAYDALNRLVSETYPNAGKNVTYGYDAGTYNSGYLTSMTDESGSTTWNHYLPGPGSHQRTNEKTQVTNGQSLVTSHVVHSLTGLPYSMTYPSGTTLTYTVSGSTGLVTALNFGGTSVFSNATYDPFGPVNGWTWGNGASYSITYNQRGEVISHNLGTDTRTLTYDVGSRLLTQADAGYQLGYGYDNLDRVTSFTAAPQAGGTLVPQAQSLGYDENGNRLSLTEDSQNTTYSVAANSNRLQNSTGATARTYTYDAAGNTLSDGVHTYVYGDRGRMESINSGATTYRYSGAGERVQKTTGSQHTLFVYGANGELLGEYDGSGNAVQETVWFEGRPVATRQGTTVYFVHADHLGTPRAVTDGNTVVWRWDSDPFGSASPATDPDGDLAQFTYNLRFPGQYWDVETGLHYNYYRTYDPSTGRYLESDPIGLAAGPNTYAYVGGNPLSAIDPLGLTTLEFLVDQGILNVDPEIDGRDPYSIDATSGTDECMNESKCEFEENKGPIPRGRYYIDTTQIDNPNFRGDWRRNFGDDPAQGDWGDWRVRIYPYPSTERQGRTGFYLHGGLFDGSRGCIQFDGNTFPIPWGHNRLLKDLQADPDNRVELTVR